MPTEKRGLLGLVNMGANTRNTGVLIVDESVEERRFAEKALQIHLLSGAVCFLNPRRIHQGLYEAGLYCEDSSLKAQHVADLLAKSGGDEDSLFFHMLDEKTILPEQLPAVMSSLSLEVLRECVSDQDSCSFEFRPREALGKRVLENNFSSACLEIAGGLEQNG